MVKNTLSKVLFTLFAALIFLSAAALPAGCGDRAEADLLVERSEELRQAATDRFRQQTAAIDAMISTVASGKSLLVSEIEATASTATREYNDAIADLRTRSGKLDEAAALELSNSYREYLDLLAASNEKLIDALTLAAKVPMIILEDEQAFAGWDELRASEVLSDIDTERQQIDAAFEEAETLRARAQQLKEDNPGDF